MYQIGLGTEVAVLNSQVVPISQLVLKTGFPALQLQKCKPAVLFFFFFLSLARMVSFLETVKASYTRPNSCTQNVKTGDFTF